MMDDLMALCRLRIGKEFWFRFLAITYPFMILDLFLCMDVSTVS
jgi:hypothetical protein